MGSKNKADINKSPLSNSANSLCNDKPNALYVQWIKRSDIFKKSIKFYFLLVSLGFMAYQPLYPLYTYILDIYDLQIHFLDDIFR